MAAPWEQPDFRHHMPLSLADTNEVQAACEQKAASEAHQNTEWFAEYLFNSQPKATAEIISLLIRGEGKHRILAKMMADKVCQDWVDYRVHAMTDEEYNEVQRATLGEAMTPDEFEDESA